jgi:hypothetical protein
MKLDFSVIDPKVPKPKAKVFFCGGETRFEFKEKSLKNFKVPYTLHQSGNAAVIVSNGTSYKYDLGGNLRGYNTRILQCCRAVNVDIRRFLSENEPLKSHKSIGIYVNQGYTTSYFLNGGRDVSLVDIDHCFWRIAFNSGIISEKTYMKFKDDRDARLIAIGCTARNERTEMFDGEKVIYSEVVPNPFRWVWDYIVFQSYKTVDSVRELVNNEIFAYMTDGIYLPEYVADAAAQKIESSGFNVKVKRYSIVGYTGSHWFVLQDKVTGEWKRANLGMSAAIKSYLPHIDNLEFNRYVWEFNRKHYGLGSEEDYIPNRGIPMSKEDESKYRMPRGKKPVIPAEVLQGVEDKSLLEGIKLIGGVIAGEDEGGVDGGGDGLEEEGDGDRSGADGSGAVSREGSGAVSGGGSGKKTAKTGHSSKKGGSKSGVSSKKAAAKQAIPPKRGSVKGGNKADKVAQKSVKVAKSGKKSVLKRTKPVLKGSGVVASGGRSNVAGKAEIKVKSDNSSKKGGVSSTKKAIASVEKAKKMVETAKNAIKITKNARKKR